jgi:hypothetical protein
LLGGVKAGRCDVSLLGIGDDKTGPVSVRPPCGDLALARGGDGAGQPSGRLAVGDGGPLVGFKDVSGAREADLGAASAPGVDATAEGRSKML